MSKPKFIDLFAGIGGFHIALENAGAECVFVSEWDSEARKTYKHAFGERNPELFVESMDGNGVISFPKFAGDITKVAPESIDDFDILCAGFPCQPFSQAGLRKGMDEARGTLFFDIVNILKVKKPRAYFLENVRGLLSHRSGERMTIDIVKEQLTNLGYTYNLFQVKASDFNTPQLRPRVFIIGFRDEDDQVRFEQPEKMELKTTLKDILGPEVNREIAYTLRVGGRGSGLSDRRNWDTYKVGESVVRIEKEHGLKIQGFPDWFSFPIEVSNSQAMKQLGNSVAVPAVEAYAKAITKALNGDKEVANQK